MKKRCTDENAKDFPCYGGRGIRVCDRWMESFQNFLADMGDKPVGATLDRINNDGDYSPENCRWASVERQSQNRRSTRLTAEIVNEIRGRFEHGESVASIASRWPVHVETIRLVVNRKTWRNLA